MNEEGPEHPGDVHVVLDVSRLACEESVEVLREELLDVEHVAANVSQHGVVGLTDAAFQYLGDDVLERVGIADAAEVNDGIIVDRRAEDFLNERLRLPVDGGSALDVDDLAEEAHDEVTEFALVIGEGVVDTEFILDALADGDEFLVEVLGHTVDGLVHKTVEMEADIADGLAQEAVHLLAFVRLQVFHNARDELGGGGEAERGIDTCAENHEGQRTVLAAEQRVGELIAEEDLLLHRGVGSVLAGTAVYVEVCLVHGGV